MRISLGGLLLVGAMLFFPSAISTESSDRLSFGSPALPTSITFAGEGIPLQDFDVQERLERELLVNAYWHSQTLYTLKKTTRFLPLMEKILAEEKVPDDLKYIAVIESSLANVVSPAGAAGFWQFMPETGKKYGLEISEEIDERYHLEKATRAAAKYLRDAYQKFGSWTLAAASYNMGLAGVDKQLTAQGVDNYYDLYLNTETARYVFRILAMKDIVTYPEKYRFDIGKNEYYKPIATRSVKVEGDVNNWAIWALEQGTTYKNLRLLNPWIRKPQLKNKTRKTYVVEVPADAKPGMRATELKRLKGTDALPDEATTPAQDYIVHEVKKGESLFGLAKRYEVKADDIVKLNDLKSNSLSEGQIIKIPLKQ